MPVYIEKVEIWPGVTDASQTHRQTTEYSATQLVLCLKFNLSHAKRTLFFHSDCCSCQIWSLWGTVTWPTAPWGQKFGLGKKCYNKNSSQIKVLHLQRSKVLWWFCNNNNSKIYNMVNILSLYCSDSLWTFQRPVFRGNSVCMFYSNDFCSHDCGAYHSLCKTCFEITFQEPCLCDECLQGKGQRRND